MPPQTQKIGRRSRSCAARDFGLAEPVEVSVATPPWGNMSQTPPTTTFGGSNRAGLQGGRCGHRLLVYDQATSANGCTVGPAMRRPCSLLLEMGSGCQRPIDRFHALGNGTKALERSYQRLASLSVAGADHAAPGQLQRSGGSATSFEGDA